LTLFHPETIEVEDMQRQIPLTHAVDETVDGGFIIIGGERCGQPQAEGPGRGQSWPAGQLRVIYEHVFDVRTPMTK